MSPILIASVVSSLVAILLAILTYYLTKQKEREADWRKMKLELYKTYIVALSGVVRHNPTFDDQTKYADALNSLWLFASLPVLKALDTFLDAGLYHNNDEGGFSRQKHLDNLLNVIRQDINPTPSSQVSNLTFRIMAPPVRGSDINLESPSVGQ
jgi:hypothetical protein